MRDPWRHLLYSNVRDFVRATESWLLHPKRRHHHTLGVGIDRSDSLLYEGVTGLVRQLAPLFGSAGNPQNCWLILSTKSTNTHYLAAILPGDRSNVVVTFSLNPERVADLWEGKWPDGERISRSINDRLLAAGLAQDLGFEIRIRLDPILTPPGWRDYYHEFIEQVKLAELEFRYWTLGTYREKNSQLQSWAWRWGVAPMEWQPDAHGMVHDGTHWHLPFQRRKEAYSTVRRLIRETFPHTRVSLCKETHAMRKQLAMCNADCNCLV
jgi:DNA repair photolyase